MELPRFKYHAAPLNTGSIAPSDRVCQVCERARGFAYQGVPYAVDDLETVSGCIRFRVLLLLRYESQCIPSLAIPPDVYWQEQLMCNPAMAESISATKRNCKVWQFPDYASSRPFGVVIRTRMTAGKSSNHNCSDTSAFAGSFSFLKCSLSRRSQLSMIQRGYVVS